MVVNQFHSNFSNAQLKKSFPVRVTKVLDNVIGNGSLIFGHDSMKRIAEVVAGPVYLGVIFTELQKGLMVIREESNRSLNIVTLKNNKLTFKNWGKCTLWMGILIFCAYVGSMFFGHAMQGYMKKLNRS